MAETGEVTKTQRGIDVLLMRVFYIEAILFMAGIVALGAYLYPTIARLVEISYKLEEIGDIGALVDAQVARVEGKLDGVTDRVSGRVDELDGKLSGFTGRLDAQVTRVETRVDSLLKGIEDRLRDIFKFKLGAADGSGRPAAAPSGR